MLYCFNMLPPWTYWYIHNSLTLTNPKEDRLKERRVHRVCILHSTTLAAECQSPVAERETSRFVRKHGLENRDKEESRDQHQSLASRLKHFLSPETRRVLKPKSKVLRLRWTLKSIVLGSYNNQDFWNKVQSSVFETPKYPPCLERTSMYSWIHRNQGTGEIERACRSTAQSHLLSQPAEANRISLLCTNTQCKKKNWSILNQCHSYRTALKAIAKAFSRE